MDLTLPQREEVSVPREIGRGTILDRWRLPDGTLYLDNAATRPMLPEVAEEMARLMANNPLNASSQHKYGQKAARMLEDARNFFKSELNVPSTGELIFNSGATEGLNMLLKSAYFADPTKNHIVTVKTEHKAVLNTCAYLETIGAEVTYLDVDEWGQVSVSDIEAAIRPTTCAVCVMWVNNVTGALIDTWSLRETCRRKGVLVISDGTQYFGKEERWSPFEIVYAVVSCGHKIGGAVGLGLVAVADSSLLRRDLHGGGQEFGLRGGTTSLVGALTMKLAYERFWRPSHCEFAEATNTLTDQLGLIDWRIGQQRAKMWSRWIIPATSGVPGLQSHSGIVGSDGSACDSGTLSSGWNVQELFIEKAPDGHVFTRLSF